MARIFICYRRADSGGHAGRLYDHLVPRFGKNRVYMDIDSIPPGADFVEEVRKALQGCAAVVVVIGQHWLSGESRQRLNMPGDFVRQEIAQALKSSVRVFPVLVHGASMPAERDLPRDIQPLARKHAIEIRDVSFQTDVQQLIRALERVEGLKSAGRKTGTAGSGAKQRKPKEAKRSGGSAGGTRAPKSGTRTPARTSATGGTTPISGETAKPTGGGSNSRRAGTKAAAGTKGARTKAGGNVTPPPKRARSSPPASGTGGPKKAASKAGGARGGAGGGGRTAKSATSKQAGGQRGNRKAKGPAEQGRRGT